MESKKIERKINRYIISALKKEKRFREKVYTIGEIRELLSKVNIKDVSNDGNLPDYLSMDSHYKVIIDLEKLVNSIIDVSPFLEYSFRPPIYSSKQEKEYKLWWNLKFLPTIPYP